MDIKDWFALGALIIATSGWVITWRAGRFKPQVDMTGIAESAQRMAESALAGQEELVVKVRTLETNLSGPRELRIVYREYPKFEVDEITYKVLPHAAVKRNTGQLRP